MRPQKIKHHVKWLKYWITELEKRLEDNDKNGVWIFSGDILDQATQLDKEVLRK